MTTYQYIALDIDGRRCAGAVDAPDEGAARRVLNRKKLLPVELRIGGMDEGVLSSVAPQARDKLGHKAQMLVTRQLATLIDAAVPVDEALAMVAAQQENAAAKRIMSNIQSGVVEGLRLSDALGRHPASFTPLYRAAVAAGERSGNLGAVLTRLADHLGRVHALRSKVTTAMIYPAVLSMVATLVVICLMIFVVPSLTEQFQAFETELPLITRILIAVSQFLASYWLFLLIGVGLATAAASRALQGEAVRERLDAGFLRAPIVGRWTAAVAASRFVRAVSTLVASGTPVFESVRIARASVGNRVAAKAVDGMAEEIEQGEPLSQAMRRSGFVPAMVVYMAASGENAGDLPGMLQKAAEHLDAEFEAFTTAAISLLEPAVIVVMGVVVASIVLAIMLPVLQLNQMAIG
ncbi:MAG: type II secretion system F family protein [Alphaproteobacteria bacterium]|nr:type II secretion system F family protein [Alphaproteobacteria bacterium]